MPGRLAGARIAIIEDDTLLRESLALFLRVRGGHVETYGSAEEAGEAVTQGRFDAVISDYLLPGENGLSFLRKVLKSSESAGTVLITAHAGKDMSKEALAAGIHTFLTKPFSTKELEAALERILERRGAGRDGAIEAT
ncbi:MAG: response regulator [Deltaproteobacteria bacterium]|nr:response regulator [Deltaproteobacteria bacterium]